MKAKFLGHGLDSENKFNVGKQLAVSFESSKYEVFNGFVAFAAISGVKLLAPFIKKARENYKQIRFFIGVDNRGTSKEALEYLIHENIETYIYHDKKQYITYHPKLFIFEGPKHARIIIGSSNLTSSGIRNNIESSIQLDFFTATDKQGQNVLAEIKDYYADLLNLNSEKLKPLDENLLNELIKQNLLFNQFQRGGKKTEPKTNDGENQEEQDERIEIPKFDIETGFEQKHQKNKYKERRFTSGDYERFETLLDRYVNYKRDVRPSGIVSKHTDDRELFRWYQKMHALYNKKGLPKDIENILRSVDFPFSGVGILRKRLIKWDKDFQKLVDYRNKVTPTSKYTHVPQFTNKSNPYYNLATWCVMQKQRRKGNYTPLWTQYEEDKMNSINFLWDASIAGSRPKDEKWADNLVELENYYKKKKNANTVPSQKTTLGHWLNDQMTLKTRQERENRNDLISEIRIEMLGELLAKNGIEWEWEKQKHRIGIENKIESWKKIEEWTNSGKIKNLTDKEKKELKKMRDDMAQLRSQSKRWNNDKHRWKYEILDKAGFPYNKQ
nr:phospholipase D family protein [uncultured Draconibacterium sp.]